jgi:phosphosulfolactate synthase (CoM biosynthesis protein A)
MSDPTQDGTPFGSLHSNERKHLHRSIPAIADLNQDISTGGPTEAEAQAISDKVDALLAALRTVGLLAE